MDRKKLLALSLGGGVAGGILSVIEGWGVLSIIGDSNFSVWWHLLILPAVVGAAAGLLGIYLLAPGAPENKTKTFVFAMVCGLAIPTWVAKGSELPGDTREIIINKTANNMASELSSELTRGEHDTVEAALKLVKLAELAARRNNENADMFSSLAYYISGTPQLSQSQAAKLAGTVTFLAGTTFHSTRVLDSDAASRPERLQQLRSSYPSPSQPAAN